MMKKNGFTLAEVLLSLAIIGVVAAVTLPSLTLNVEKRKIGPAVMKAVNTLESSTSLALQTYGARKLTEVRNKGVNTKENKALISDLLLEFTKFTEVPYEPKVGETPSGATFGTKDGIVFFDSTASDNGSNGKSFLIVVDTNGSRGPNVYGRDLFELYVLDNGLVAPQGSYLINKEGIQGALDWRSGCASMTKDNKKKPDYPKACAGAIVDNGGRVLYNYEAISLE